MPENTFKSLYLAHTASYESPSSFWIWSAYASIASVLKDSCYAYYGDSKIYTNIYVLILAQSGARKGAPVGLCETVINKVNNTKIISGRTSIQAILDELARVETDEKTGKVQRAGTAVFIAKELAAGIVGDPAAVDILTDIYDYNPNPYRHLLRTGPRFKLDSIILTMIAASNEAMIKGFIDNKAVMGGLLARTFLVVPNEWRPANSLLMNKSTDTAASLSQVVDALRTISLMKGTFIITPEAEKAYDTWYIPFREKLKNSKDSSGVMGRIHTSILKLAMIKAANDLTLNISDVHINESIDECIALIPNYNTFIMSTGKSTIKDAGAIFMTSLMNNRSRRESRSNLLRDNWQHFDGETLDKLVVTLEQAKLIRTFIEKGSTWYELTDECIRIMKGE